MTLKNKTHIALAAFFLTGYVIAGGGMGPRHLVPSGSKAIVVKITNTNNSHDKTVDIVSQTEDDSTTPERKRSHKRRRKVRPTREGK